MKVDEYITQADLAKFGDNLSANFDAKLDAKIDKLSSEFDAKLDAKLEKAIEVITVKVTGLVLDILIPQITEMFDTQLKHMDARFDAIENRLDSLEESHREVKTLIIENMDRLDHHESRITHLDKAIRKHRLAKI